MTYVNDPKTYREMSQPLESGEAADKAINEFMAELRELRKKHKIANVYVILQGAYVNEEGDESEYIVSGLAGGHALGAVAMTAHAFGYEKAQQAEYIAKVLGAAVSPKKVTKQR